MAQLYYKYGRAAEIDDDDNYDGEFSLLSLQGMTESSDEGKWSPYYRDYIEYYKTEKYADSAILAAFDGDDDAEMRRAEIVSLMRYFVIPEYMMSLLGLALEVCGDTKNSEQPTRYWDAFAALYIGSLEGIKSGGSEDDGVLLWGLAENRARQFNTQNNKFGARVNDEMTDLLFAGQSELERKDCTNFEKTASRVLHLMLVPLIQSAIWYAIRNEKFNPDSIDKDLVIGEVMASSVLPIVARYDDNAASEIERNMILSYNVSPVSEGPQAVANAFFRILDDIGWGCDYVGQAEGIDTCEQYASTNGRSSGSMVSKPGVSFLLVGVVSLLWGITTP